MTDDMESAVATWFDSDAAKRDIAIAHKRLLGIKSAADPVYIALMVQILESLNWGAGPEPGSPEDELLDDEFDDEPWKRSE
jgi:hypothetical protein